MMASISTLRASLPDAAALGEAAARVVTSQLDPVAFDVHAVPGPQGSGGTLLLRFASTPRATRAQVDAARALLHGADTDVLEGVDEAGVWRAQVARAWDAPGLVARLAWRSASLQHVIDRLATASSEFAVEIELAGRVSVGAGVVRIGGTTERQARVIAALRAEGPLFGAVVLLRADRVCKDLIDVWGAPSGAMTALASIKAAFDPAGILNAGRGPV